MWCCELYCFILSKITLTKWTNVLKILLKRHHWVLSYCFLPHTTPCIGPWELGGCKSHFCFVSVLLQVFCQLERQEAGARTCSFQFVCWFCHCHPSWFQWQLVTVPSFFPHSQTRSFMPLIIMLVATLARQRPFLRGVSPDLWILPPGTRGTSELSQKSRSPDFWVC